MKDVKEYFISVIGADTIIKSQLGIFAGTSDPRVYPTYQPDAVVDARHPSYIVYRLLSYGEAGGRIRQPILRFTIWALTESAAEATRDSLLRLFDKKKLTTAAPSSRIIYSKQIYETDTPPESTGASNFPGKVIDFRVGYEDAGVA